MKFVQHWVDHLNRHRYRIRRAGKLLGELPVNGDPSSPEFMAAYHAILRGEKPGQAIADATAQGGSGSVKDALDRYFVATTFTDLSASTQALRKSLLRGFAQPPVAMLPLAQMDEAFIRRWLETSSTTGVKRTRFLAIRPFLKWACEQKLIKVNPTDAFKVEAEEGDGHHTWDDDEIKQYRNAHPLGTMARLALELLLAMAARKGDGVALGPQHRKQVNGSWRLVFTQEKNRKHKPVTVSIIIPDELQAAIDACPARPEALTYLTNEYGNPFSKEGFSHWFRKKVAAAGLPDRCVAHGLRKAACRIMAEAGCTPHMIRGKSGHRTLKEVERYTAAVNDVIMAKQAHLRVEAAKRNNTVVPLKAAVGE